MAAISVKTSIDLSSPVAVGILSDAGNILDEHKGHLYEEK